MTDDDEPDEPEPLTPPIRKRPMRFAMTDDERDTRRAETAQGMGLHRSPALGVPETAMQDEDPETGPVARIEAIELDERDRRHARRLKHDSVDPIEFGVKLGKLVYQLEKKEESNNTQRANQLLELLNRPPHEDVAELQRSVKALQKRNATVTKYAWPIILIVLGGIGGWLVFIAERISSYSERVGAQTETLREHSNTLQEIKADIRDLRNRKDSP